MDNQSESIVEMQRRLKAMPEFHLVEEIRGFSRSIAMFDGNYKQLKEQLDFFEDAYQSIHLDQAGNEEIKKKFQAEVMRLMHNYVASAFSLVDHSRIHYRNLYENGSFPEYQQRVDAVFVTDPLSQFMKGLRQYFLHCGLPPIYFQTKWEKTNPQLIRTILLENDALQNFTWNANAKKYLTEHLDDINLTVLIESYYQKVVDFYEWFQIRQSELHSTEFAKVESMRTAILRRALPDILNSILQFPDLSSESLELHLLPYLPRDEQIIFSLMDPGTKADFLLVVLKSMADLSDAVEGAIRRLYS